VGIPIDGKTLLVVVGAAGTGLRKPVPASLRGGAGWARLRGRTARSWASSAALQGTLTVDGSRRDLS